MLETDNATIYLSSKYMDFFLEEFMLIIKLKVRNIENEIVLPFELYRQQRKRKNRK